ncbi:hypothetical protein [Methanolobus sp. ZRKC5]|uniref:hypothetical protein n=1 Tax=unclassified Methanolobus TaxID=2629569 RepID=UPI00313BFDB6
MNKIILISFLLFFFLVTPANAEIFSEMNQKVVVYNQNVDKVPDSLKSLLGNEEIYGVINLNDGNTLEVKAVTKDGKIIDFSKLGTKIAINKGDCNGDNNLTALDALCTLQMAVGKMEKDDILDVDDSGGFSSLDARIILQNAVGLNSEVDPSIIVTTNENSMNDLMNSQKPLDVFLDAYDSGDIDIKGVGLGKSITISIGKFAFKMSQSLGIL